MPTLPPDSSDSPPPSVTPSGEHRLARIGPATAGSSPLAWRRNAWLFAATVVSVFSTWMHDQEPSSVVGALHALAFTAALLGILLAHEFGHYIAARIHRVDASLPYFIPLPIVSPFGTMGAVIRMRAVIPTRRALLDIGAAGPLAGLALAIPLYAWGVAHSQVVAVPENGDKLVEFGNSLLLRLLDHWFAPPSPQGTDVMLSPVAFAGWAGMFVTMINLFPVGQLDGGHVAFALFGPRQNRIAHWVHRSMLAFFFVSLFSFVARDVRSAEAGSVLWHLGMGLGRNVNNSIFWLVWFELLAILGTLSPVRGGQADGVGVRTRLFATLGLALLAAAFRDQTSPVVWVAWFAALGVLIAMEVRSGALRSSSTLLDHPATGPEPLRPGRAAVAILTLAFFVLLFMPTPISF